MDIHEVVTRIKALSQELGRTPTKADVCREIVGFQYWLNCSGTTWTQLLHATGQSSYAERRSRKEGSGRLTNAIFERSVEEVISEHKPLVRSVLEPISTTLIIPDTHFPWVNNKVLEKAYRWAEKNKPQRVVQLGDLYDMYAHAKFPRSLNVYSPQEEERLGRDGAEKIWATIRGIVAGAECVQLKGNHDVRPLKRTLENLPSLEHVVAKHLDRLMTFEGVTLITDPRQEYIVGDTEFIHGYRSRLGEHRDYAQMNAVCGHIHVGGVVFRGIRGRTLWELNCGLAGDPEAKVFGYTPQKITPWTPGFGAIDEDGPRFIPL